MRFIATFILGVILVFLLILISLTSCGVKPAFEKAIVTSNVIYEGPMNAPIKSSAKVMGWYRDVEDCMGVSGIEPPMIRVIEGNRVQCPGNDVPRFGCHRSGTIIMPKSGLENVWKHEDVHYILWKTTGNADAGHTSEFFGKCSGLALIPGE